MNENIEIRTLRCQFASDKILSANPFPSLHPSMIIKHTCRRCKYTRIIIKEKKDGNKLTVITFIVSAQYVITNYVKYVQVPNKITVKLF